MARSARQSKIIEIISANEVETQEELVSALCLAGFDVTQATISRDIKELGLIKIAGERKKYRYSFVGNDDKVGTNKALNIFKQAVFSVKYASNLVVLKTLRGTSSAVANFIDRLSIEHTLGCVYGDDTVMLIAENSDFAQKICNRLTLMLAD